MLSKRRNDPEAGPTTESCWPALAERLVDASTNETFYAELRSRCAAKLPLTDPKLERDSWRSLLKGLAHLGSARG